MMLDGFDDYLEECDLYCDANQPEDNKRSELVKLLKKKLPFIRFKLIETFSSISHIQPCPCRGKWMEASLTTQLSSTCCKGYFLFFPSTIHTFERPVLSSSSFL